MKPNRIRLVLKAVEAFIKEFFDQNPLSQMGIIVSHSSIAEKLSELNGKNNLIVNSFLPKWEHL